MEQFLTLDIGSSKATIDLSKVRKSGLVYDKGLFGKKPKIVIYYTDNTEDPEISFELQTSDEAEETYAIIERRLDRWATESNSIKIQNLRDQLVLMEQQKQAMVDQTETLLVVFDKFKEMMAILEDETETSSLVATIKAL